MTLPLIRYSHLLYNERGVRLYAHLDGSEEPMKRRIPVAIAIAFLVVMLSACGASASTKTVVAVTVTSAPASTPIQALSQPKTAAQILQLLKAQGLPIGAGIIYTAENDANHLLGRPGQYTGKVNFID